MSMRIFVDDDGREWQVFDVVPRADERRHHDRRAADDDSVDIERRRTERRLSVGRTSLPMRSNEGWLCFESRGDRRRLRPIPDDWKRADEGTLSAHCRVAASVKAPGPAAEKSAAVSPRR